MSNETNIHLWSTKRVTKASVTKQIAKKLGVKVLDIQSLSMKDLKTLMRDTRKGVKVKSTKKSTIVAEIGEVYPEMGSLSKLTAVQLQSLGAALENWEKQNEEK